MEVVLEECGNGAVAVPPPAMLKNLGLSAGQAMTLDTTEQDDRQNIYDPFCEPMARVRPRASGPPPPPSERMLTWRSG
jgi:hypothetical protein